MHRSEPAPPLRPRATLPLPRLGILGGGQLAKMTATAAVQFGCEVVVLERREDFPAHSMDTHALIGDWNDPAMLLQLAPLVDVVTLENEFVSTDALDVLSRQPCGIWPSIRTIRMVQDKFVQKSVFASAGLPVVRFAEAPTPEAVVRFGLPVVLKKRLQSYDGKGNATVREAADLPVAWARLNGDNEPLYVEELCPFVRELAIIITRGRDGTLVHYPAMETVNRDHICHIVRGPVARPGLAGIAATAVNTIDGTGSFGLEFFEMADGRVLLNEIAPRVHNTGHYTIEACACSQFENHVRAVLGWPPGPAELRAPAAAMVNLLGYGDGPGTPVGLADALQIPGAHVHIYGKTQSARGRKMGHVTALGTTPAEAHATAQRAADCIRFGGSP
jgi:5-(carboxyamino)imidazole ribonucleotide synthase